MAKTNKPKESFFGKKAKEESDLITFVLINTKYSNWGIDCYEDKGKRMHYVSDPHAKKLDGSPKRRRLYFEATTAQRFVYVHRDDTEWLEFIRNSPWCEGSPNQGGEVMYKELNPVEEAQKKNQFVMKKVQAQAQIYELWNTEQFDKFEDLCLACGIYSSANEDMAVVLSLMVDYAAKNPEKIIGEKSWLTNPNLGLIGLIKRAEMAGHIRVVGTQYIMKVNGTEEIIGNNLDMAISYLAANTSYRTTLEALVKS